MAKQIVDAFGRVHTNLRVSVTDRCNIHCFYCMPNEHIQFLPHAEIMTFEEIQRFVAVASRLGVNKIRITGGEPLVRSQVERLVEQLVATPGIDDVALTTNGMLLANKAENLFRAGLHRLNISLDTLDETVFERISRRQGLQKVLDGIEAAIDVGFEQIRLNAISIKGLTENEILPLVGFARDRNLELRFIEFMPLDADQKWDIDQVLTGARVRDIIEDEYGKLQPVHRSNPSQPAVDFGFADGRGRIGFINPVSQPFCHDCNRLRITAEGKIRNCLFSIREWDARSLLRSGVSDQQIEQLILDCVASKKAAHGIDSSEFLRPEKAMYQIGG